MSLLLKMHILVSRNDSFQTAEIDHDVAVSYADAPSKFVASMRTVVIKNHFSYRILSKNKKIWQALDCNELCLLAQSSLHIQQWHSLGLIAYFWLCFCRSLKEHLVTSN